MGGDPFARVKQIKPDHKAKETLTPGEIERPLATCDQKRLAEIHGY